MRNRFWPPPAKADIATAILTNVIEHLVLLFCPPISTPSPPKRCGRIFGNFMGKFTNSMGCCHISPRGATLSFTLRSKGEGGQPRYLIIQEIASHFSTPPPTPRLPRTLRADSKHCNLQYFCSFRIKKPHFVIW